MGTFQSWCSSGWLSITLSFFPTPPGTSQPSNPLLSSPLNRATTLSLFAAFNVTHCKSIEGLPQLLSTFQVLIFLHTNKKIIGYY